MLQHTSPGRPVKPVPGPGRAIAAGNRSRLGLCRKWPDRETGVAGIPSRTSWMEKNVCLTPFWSAISTAP